LHQATLRQPISAAISETVAATNPPFIIPPTVGKGAVCVLLSVRLSVRRVHSDE